MFKKFYDITVNFFKKLLAILSRICYNKLTIIFHKEGRLL